MSIEERERENMKVRDMFAAATLQAIIVEVLDTSNEYRKQAFDKAAEISYEVADAMMRRRDGES